MAEPVAPALSLEQVARELADLKGYLSNLYVPKHMDSLLKKVGTIEAGVQRTQDSMATCYNISFFLVFLFVVILLGVVYVLWRLNYFKFWSRQNLFGRYTRPRSCYACYRPWRRAGWRHRETVAKGSFSSPELLREVAAPALPLVVREAASSSSSGSSWSENE